MNAATTPTRQPRPWHAQLRRIHAIANELGLSHDDLHNACGVSSLKQLTDRELKACTDRLEVMLEHRRRQRFAGPRLVGSPYADATYKQRLAIDKLFGALRWSRSRRRHWLSKRHEVDSPWSAELTIGTARQIIKQLGEALKKRPSDKPAEPRRVTA